MTTQDRARYAVHLASGAGARLLEVRSELAAAGLEPAVVKDRGDAASQQWLMQAIGAEFPDDAVLSEEGADDLARLTAAQVWIVDPLDGTREFSELERDDWAVHVAVWERGELTAGAVALPARGVICSSVEPQRVEERPDGIPLRLAVSRSQPPAFVTELAERLDGQLVAMGSAGVKAMSVVAGDTDAYVHAGGQYEWDSAAPVAVARAAGLHASRIDGSPLVYNNENPWLPDLVVCRPEMADRVLAEIAALG